MIELFRMMLQVRAFICHPTGLPVFSVYSVITSIRPWSSCFGGCCKCAHLFATRLDSQFFSVYSVITSIRLFRVVSADAASARIYLPPDWTPSFFCLFGDHINSIISSCFGWCSKGAHLFATRLDSQFFSVYSAITSIWLFRFVLADAASARIDLPPDWTPSFFQLCSRPRPRTWREETQIMIISFQE